MSDCRDCRHHHRLLDRSNRLHDDGCQCRSAALQRYRWHLRYCDAFSEQADAAECSGFRAGGEKWEIQ